MRKLNLISLMIAIVLLIAIPMEAEISLLGSLVSFLAITAKVISPDFSCFKPSFFEIIAHFGGKILETLTILHFSIPAALNANSKDDNLFVSTPTPFVKKSFFGTILLFYV